MQKINQKIYKTAFTFSGQGIIINKENTIGILVRSHLDDDLSKIDYWIENVKEPILYS